MVMCKLCNYVMYGNMAAHLRCIHPKEYMQWQKAKKRRLTQVENSFDSLSKKKTDKGKKYSSIWKFYEVTGDNMAKCKLCQAIMKKNMSRHLQTKHATAYKQWQKARESTEEFTRRTTDKPTYTCSFRQGWVKQYMKKVGEKKYECNLCHKILKMPVGDYSSMKRHVRSKHPYYYEKEMVATKVTEQMLGEAEKCEVIEYIIEVGDSHDPLLDNDAILSAIESHQAAKSDDEDSSTEIDTESATQESKNTTKVIPAASLDRADNELEQPIKEVCDQVVEVACESSSSEFEVLDRGCFKCKTCGLMLVSGDDLQPLIKHLQDDHPDKHDIENEITIVNINSEIDPNRDVKM